MSTNDSNSTLSLLDREATGGEVAERGFTYQDAILLANLPCWLAEEGFTSLIRESLSDIEAMFYVPGVGYRKEFVEVKDHLITLSEFKAELKRFRKMEQVSPDTFRWFTLVCPSISDALKPMVNGMRRLRGPYDFYATDTNVQEESFKDFASIVTNLDKDSTLEDATFLFTRVALKTEYGHDIPGEALFRQHFLELHPEYGDLPSSRLTVIFDKVKRLISGRLREPVSRKEIETAIRSAIPEQHLPAARSVILRTLSGKDVRDKGLCFEWEMFFGGGARTYPLPAVWETGLIRPLRDTKQWITEQRLTRRLRLEGSRRLSAAIALGATFPAVSGFVIEMNYRGEIWATDTYAQQDADPYAILSEQIDGEGDELVVVFSILKNIKQEVLTGLPSLSQDKNPILSILGQEPITSPAQANAIVARVKDTIHRSVTASRYRKVHLFYAGPSHLAVFLGHRLNAISTIQCYEWIAENQYTPTCLVFS